MMKRVLFLFLLFVSAFAAQAQTADEVIAKSFEALGGADKWRAIKTTKSEAKMAMMGFEFAGVIYGAEPNKMRVEVDVMGQKVVQAYDGTTAWWINPLQMGPDPQVMPDEMAESMKNQEFQSALLDYKEKGHSVTLEGEETIEGAACYKLKLTKKDGTEELHFFDKESYAPIMMRTAIKTGPSAGQFTEVFMSDYQEVNGLMFAFFLETKVAGQTVQKITLSNVTIDEAMGNEMFAFPKK